ncbi:MAG TPA: 2-succinyl-5-enolpyruvyl-6-hydroxy-3-cyclohexene-1-carboxylic-acid synthase [Polyangiaceae bacterium]|jgi:2-succinyl-5-enolpyruvyl-6-hydroxy-3-cyclohexene-1-carboxylate synthase|nr:2-succinyl-5-enolpyruvyl-6-hydroxy-3-cyclohexene-1-carboxylic-acid synthase [Polyangiaceae bacterium]
MTPENLLSEWARLLVVSLADAGLRELVVSPGSRSTPLVAAALASNRFRMHSVVDERSAAFFALGHAKARGTPSAVLCTSGSAAANYFPAIVEARAARVPLLVITADRPFELHDCGAPQTMEQTRLYGEHVVRFVELGMPDGERAALVGLQRRAVQCIEAALGPEPGPVHVNVRARKPLEPVTARTDAARSLTTTVDELLRTPITRASRVASVPAPSLVEDVARALGATSRGLIVCGPAELGAAALGPSLAELSRLTGFPVYAETTSQLRFAGSSTLPAGSTLDGLDVLLRVPHFRATFAPEVVLAVGAPPTSGAWERFVAEHPAVERHVVASAGWPDPSSTARTLLLGDPEASLCALVAAVSPAKAPHPAWAAELSVANAAAWSAVDGVLADEASLSEGGVLRAVMDALPAGALFGVGNSLPVRHVDVFCRARPAADLGVWSQRGVSGIDGVVSGAAGAADASGRPTVLVVGDVSALHDMGGFAVAKNATTPLVVVVLNNAGGRIFEQLPIAGASLGEDAERFWTTPHQVRFDAIAGAFGLPYVRPESVGALVQAVRDGLGRPGCTLVEAVVPAHGAREQYARLAAATESALARGASP